MLSAHLFSRFNFFTMVNERFEQWLVGFELCKEFAKENGNFVISRSKDKALFIWMSNQRQRYRMGKLSEAKVELLDSISFPFRCQQQTKKRPSHAKWDTVYHRLMQFKMLYGHCNVPFRHTPDRSLGHWVC